MAKDNTICDEVGTHCLHVVEDATAVCCFCNAGAKANMKKGGKKKLKQVEDGVYREVFRNAFHAGRLSVMPTVLGISPGLEKIAKKARRKGFYVGALHASLEHDECPDWHEEDWNHHISLSGASILAKRVRIVLERMLGEKEPEQAHLKSAVTDLRRALRALDDFRDATAASALRFVPPQVYANDPESVRIVEEADKANAAFNDLNLRDLMPPESNA